jgi:ABC-2 type transport system permease protein
MSEHYLTVTVSYGIMLIAEVLIWNVFGFDRGATQAYFVMPVPFATVLFAKNLVALFFTVLEALMVAAVCAVLGLPLTPLVFLEAFGVLFVLATGLIAIGNLLSVRNARPVDPDHSWGRGSAGRSQAILLVVYPVVLGPLALAFLARHAFESEWAFYGVLGVLFAVVCVVYWVAFESALETASEKREEIVAVLSQEKGVLSN